jgi:hypothetical protein
MTIRIFGHPPMQHGVDGTAINVVFQNGEKMLSLALDNSCGGMSLLGRGSIELHRKKGEDSELEIVTAEVFGPDCRRALVHNSLENFNKAMSWLNRVEYGFQAQATSSWRHSER